MPDILDAIDRFQRKHRFLSFPIAVIYKYADDQGNYLAAVVSYYAFIAIFPILLILSSILGFFLQGDPDLQEQLLDTALSQFPIIGDQLGRPEGITGSRSAVIVGSVAAIYGSLGLGHAGQHVMYTAWSVPRNSRPNPFLLRFRSLVLLMTAGIAIVIVTATSTVLNNFSLFGFEFVREIELLIHGASVAMTTAAFTILFWMASGRIGRWRTMLPGAFAVAVMWQTLQFVGTIYVERVIGRASAVNATFALVLGLIGLIWIAAVMAILAIEINVVRARRLYPRALLTPFTDNVSLTEADERAYRYYAKAQRHKGFQSVRVVFQNEEKASTKESSRAISETRPDKAKLDVPESADRSGTEPRRGD